MNDIWLWIVVHPVESIGIFLAIAEGITRLTPTKKDDGFILRLGKAVDFVLSKLPNRVK